MKIGICLLIIAILLAACAPPTGATIPAPTLRPTVTLPLPTLSAPSAGRALDALKNGTYRLASSGIAAEVTLVDGAFKVNDAAHNQTVSGRMSDLAAFGDLDGDGEPDAAVIIAANYGGSGTFHEMIAVLAKDGKRVQAANLPLGDRIQEKAIDIQKGIIILDYLRHGSKDPMCCPSEHAQTTYQLKSNQLVVLNDQVLP